MAMFRKMVDLELSLPLGPMMQHLGRQQGRRGHVLPEEYKIQQHLSPINLRM